MHQNVSFHHLARWLWCFVSLYFAEAAVSPLIVSDPLDIIILSQHYDMICSNSICLANLIETLVRHTGSTKCECCSHLIRSDNPIISFIVLFFCHHFSPFSRTSLSLLFAATFVFAGGIEWWFHMSLCWKRGYIFLINIICVFLRFTCLLFQLPASHNFWFPPPLLRSTQGMNLLPLQQKELWHLFFLCNLSNAKSWRRANTHTALQWIYTEISSFIRKSTSFVNCSKWNLLSFPSWFPFVIQIRPNFQFIIRIFIRYIYFPGNFVIHSAVAHRELSSVRKLTVNKM